MEPTPGFEPGTSSLPRKCSTPELCGHYTQATKQPSSLPSWPILLLERVMGIEPTSSAWKAEVLPLNYTRLENRRATFFGTQKIPTVICIQTVWMFLSLFVFPKGSPPTRLPCSKSLVYRAVFPALNQWKTRISTKLLYLPPPSTVELLIWWRG